MAGKVQFLRAALKVHHLRLFLFHLYLTSQIEHLTELSEKDLVTLYNQASEDEEIVKFPDIPTAAESVFALLGKLAGKKAPPAAPPKNDLRCINISYSGFLVATIISIDMILVASPSKHLLPSRAFKSLTRKCLPL